MAEITYPKSNNRLLQILETIYPDEDPKVVMRRLHREMGSYRAIAKRFGVGRDSANQMGFMANITFPPKVPERYDPIVKWIQCNGSLDALHRKVGTWEAVAEVVGVTPRVMKTYRTYAGIMPKKFREVSRGDWKRRYEYERGEGQGSDSEGGSGLLEPGEGKGEGIREADGGIDWFGDEGEDGGPD